MADVLETIKQAIYTKVDNKVTSETDVKQSWRDETDLLSLYVSLKLLDKLDTVVIDAGAYIAIACRICGKPKQFYINSEGLTPNDIERLRHEIKLQPRCECEK